MSPRLNPSKRAKPQYHGSRHGGYRGLRECGGYSGAKGMGGECRGYRRSGAEEPAGIAGLYHVNTHKQQRSILPYSYILSGNRNIDELRYCYCIGLLVYGI